MDKRGTTIELPELGGGTLATRGPDVDVRELVGSWLNTELSSVVPVLALVVSHSCPERTVGATVEDIDGRGGFDGGCNEELGVS